MNIFCRLLLWLLCFVYQTVYGACDHPDRVFCDRLTDDALEVQVICRDCTAITAQARYVRPEQGEYAGLFAIPAREFVLPLYTGADWQALTDAEDCGCLIVDPRWPMPIVGDHVHQGFAVIKTAIVGETVAIFAGDGFVCTLNEAGYNLGRDLVTVTGVSASELAVDLLTYTCNDDGTICMVGWVRR